MTSSESIEGDSTPDSDLIAVYLAMREKLHRYILRLVHGREEDAEDLLSTVMVKLLAFQERNDSVPRNLSAWLFRLAHNTVMDFYRSAKPNVQLDDDIEDVNDADNVMMHQELAGCLRPLVSRLPEIYRDTLLATDFDGKPLQLVADDQGVSLSAVKSRASRGRKLLKTVLLECCHVETESGMVSDYHCRMPSSCH